LLSNGYESNHENSHPNNRFGLNINVYTQHFLRHTVKFANSNFGSAEFVIRIVEKRQNIASKTDAFQRWEFLRPFGSKRTEFERQIRLKSGSAEFVIRQN
jgi:hypothetical protein